MGDLHQLDTKKPRKLGETEWSDGGLRLPLMKRLKQERWPWFVLAAAPFVGVAVAYLWQFA